MQSFENLATFHIFQMLSNRQDVFLLHFTHHHHQPPNKRASGRLRPEGKRKNKATTAKKKHEYNGGFTSKHVRIRQELHILNSTDNINADECNDKNNNGKTGGGGGSGGGSEATRRAANKKNKKVS
jgi:hypothetical protein